MSSLPQEMLGPQVVPPRKPPVAPPLKPALIEKPTVEKPVVEKPVLAKPTGPPVPPLLALGYPGSIQDFNRQVEDIHRNTVAVNGVPPDPATMLKQAIAPTKALPTNPALLTNAEFVKQTQQAAGQAGWNAYLNANEGRIKQLQTDPRWGPKIHGIVLGATGDAVSPATASALPGIPIQPVRQIVSSLVHAPGGMIKAAAAFVQDVNAADPTNLSHLGHSDPSFKRTRKIGAAMMKQIEQDVRNPKQNAGYLFLDLLGVASLGAGTAARLGAAGRAFGETGELGAAAKAAAQKAPLRTTEVRVGDYTEQMPLSSNPLITPMQEKIIARRQAAADKRLAGTPNPLRSILMPEGQLLDSQLSFERKVGREADARKRIETTLASSLANDLPHVAGATARTTTLYDKLPEAWRKQLTVGENKAIQAHSWDVEGTPLDKVKAEEAFHHRMIDTYGELEGPQFVKNHQRHLTELALAQKAIENPSPRFTKALDLAQTVAEEGQRLRVEKLGLSPLTADGRIAKTGAVLRGEDLVRTPDGGYAVREPGTGRYYDRERDLNQTQTVLRGEQKRLATLEARLNRPSASGVKRPRPKLQARVEKQRANVIEWQMKAAEDEKALNAENVVTSLERKTEDSFYLTSQKRSKQTKRGSFRHGQPGPYGIPPGRNLPPELTHEFTGDSLVSGENRTDAANLATEAYGRTVRAIAVREEHQKLWDTGRPTWEGIPEPYRVAIRDINRISDEHRAVIAAIDDATTAGKFTNTELGLLPHDMRVMIEDLYPEKVPPEELEHVRWQDARLLGENSTMPFVPGLGTEVAQALNAPVRFARLFLRPAYILNKFQNRISLVFDQGYLNSIQNISRALNAEELYGVPNANKLRALTGHGRSESYVTSVSGKASQSVAHFWARWTDRDERVASLLYYLDRLGYDTPEKVNAALNDKAHAADLNQAVRRGNKALVEFDNLSNIEKNYLRQAIFVYPWVSRSAVWSLRAIMEHPAKTAILSQLGREAIQNDPILDHAVEWYKRIGYFPMGHDSKGLPQVGNPTSINAFTTWQDFLAIGQGITAGDKYATVGDLLGPAAEFGLHAISGRDQFGNKYPGSQFWGAANEMLLGLPQLSKLNRPPEKPLRPFSITDRASLEARVNSALGQTVFTPGWLGGYGSLLIGGFSPRGVNNLAMTARYWRDASNEDRHAWSLDLLQRAAKMQAKLLGKPLPREIAAGIQRQAEISYQYSKFLTASGRAPTARERADFTLGYLAPRIPVAALKTETAKLHALVDKGPIDSWTQALFAKYGGGQALLQWDQDVRTVASFNKESFNFKAARLFKQGLAPQRVYQTPQDDLYAYGRKYLAFTAEIRDLHAQVKAGKASMEDLRLYQDDNSTTVNGLPSFAALAWAHQTPEQQQHAIARTTTQNWATLTAVEKHLLGRDVTPTVQEGWASYNVTLRNYRNRNQTPDKNSLVKQINRDHPGFTQDYLYSTQPRVERFTRTSVYKGLPDKGFFDTNVLSAAKANVAAIKANHHIEFYRRQWKQYVQESVWPSVQDSDLGQHLIALFGSPPAAEKFLVGLGS